MEKSRESGKLFEDEKNNIAKVVKLIRLRSNLEQVEFTRVVGISQATLSKIENGKLEISAGQYRDLTRIYNISEYEWDHGILDSAKPVKYTEKSKSIKDSLCYLPSRFNHHCGSSVRTTIPFINYAKSALGVDVWMDFLKKKGIYKRSENYFYDYDNTLNLNFILDLLGAIGQKSTVNAQTLKNIAASASTQTPHGLLNQFFLKSIEPLDRARSLVKKANVYDVDTACSIINDTGTELDIEIKAKDHLELFPFIDTKLGDILGHYKKAFLENFIDFSGGKNHGKFLVTLTEGWKKDTNRWLYNVKALA